MPRWPPGSRWPRLGARGSGSGGRAYSAFDPKGSAGVSFKDTAQGTATSVLLAASPLVAGLTGRYFEDCNEAGPHQPGVRRGVAGYALDPDNAARLWRLSADLLSAA
jgi:hypothetical protein